METFPLLLVLLLVLVLEIPHCFEEEDERRASPAVNRTPPIPVAPLCLKRPLRSRTVCRARAHGMWTYEPRQGRKAATVVCSVSAVVTLAFFEFGVRNAECGIQQASPHKVHSALRTPNSALA